MERLVESVRDIEAALGDGVKRVYKSEVPVMQKRRMVDALRVPAARVH